MAQSTSLFDLIPLGSATGILAVVLVLGGLIFFHELGHFLAARFFKVGVKTFSLGFGPAICSIKRSTTRYQIAAFPLGGFVSMVGESNPGDIPEPFTIKDSFAARSAWQRLVVIAAGPVCNLFLAWLLYTWLFFTHGQIYLLPVIGQVFPNSAAAEAGLAPGDTVLAIDDKEAARWDDLFEAVLNSEGRALLLTVDNNGVEKKLSVTPRPFERSSIFNEKQKSWAIGVSPDVNKTGLIRFSLLDSARQGFLEGARITAVIGQSLGKLINRTVPLDSVGGPIRIVQEIHNQTQKNGLTGVLLIAAFISLNLGLLNLLPIPVLDGGHIVFMTFELVFRRPVPERFIEIATRVGIVLLLSLMVFTTVNDVTNWIHGQ